MGKVTPPPLQPEIRRLEKIQTRPRFLQTRGPGSGVSTPGGNEAATGRTTSDVTTLEGHSYITREAESGLDAEFALGSLTTGLLKHTVSGGVSTPATAVAGTDYYNPGGTDVAVADGGTGASTAAGARTNLEAAPNTIKAWCSDAESELSAEFDMSTLGDGILRHAVSGGVSTPAVVTIGNGLSFSSPTLSSKGYLVYSATDDSNSVTDGTEADFNNYPTKTANTWEVGMVHEFDAGGCITVDATPVTTFVMKFYIGATAIFQTAAVPVTPGATDEPWRFTGSIITRDISATEVVRGSAQLCFGGQTYSYELAADKSPDFTADAALKVAIDFTPAGTVSATMYTYRVWEYK